jgi:hypothetical protein
MPAKADPMERAALAAAIVGSAMMLAAESAAVGGDSAAVGGDSAGIEGGVGGCGSRACGRGIGLGDRGRRIWRRRW